MMDEQELAWSILQTYLSALMLDAVGRALDNFLRIVHPLDYFIQEQWDGVTPYPIGA